MTRKRSAITVVELLVIIAIGCVIVALLLPNIRSVREPARRMSCGNNLKQITLALLEYADANGNLPPAYTVDTDGNRLHSWRTLILPYLEQSQLFKSIDLSKPWDDPTNANAREAVVDVYWCPSASHKQGLTTYLGVFGPDCVFNGSVPRQLSEITDKPEATIIVIDVESDKAVHWMSPYDIDERGVLELGKKSRVNHPEIFLAAFVSGRSSAIDLNIDSKILRAMLTIAGGEVVLE